MALGPSAPYQPCARPKADLDGNADDDDDDDDDDGDDDVTSTTTMMRSIVTASVSFARYTVVNALRRSLNVENY